LQHAWIHKKTRHKWQCVLPLYRVQMSKGYSEDGFI